MAFALLRAVVAHSSCLRPTTTRVRTQVSALKLGPLRAMPTQRGLHQSWGVVCALLVCVRHALCAQVSEIEDAFRAISKDGAFRGVRRGVHAVMMVGFQAVHAAGRRRKTVLETTAPTTNCTTIIDRCQPA